MPILTDSLGTQQQAFGRYFLRFSNYSWEDYPLTAENSLDGIAAAPEKERIFNIWMGYEAFGYQHRPESGIYDF